MLRTVRLILQPILDALFKPGIRWECRWRLFVLQPISILTYLVTAPLWMFSHAYIVSWIPTREGRSVRALVFRPRKRQPNKLHPLHLDIHGGGFLGGFPEYEAKFTSLLCERAGAVVISTHYRYAPVHPFPAAIDDIDDVVHYLQQNAEQLWGADPKLMTVSGFSARGNLALAACQQSACHAPSPYVIKASATFYAPVSVVIRIQKWDLQIRSISARHQPRNLSLRTFRRKIHWRFSCHCLMLMLDQLAPTIWRTLVLHLSCLMSRDFPMICCSLLRESISSRTIS